MGGGVFFEQGGLGLGHVSKKVHRPLGVFLHVYKMRTWQEFSGIVFISIIYYCLLLTIVVVTIYSWRRPDTSPSASYRRTSVSRIIVSPGLGVGGDREAKIVL